MNKESVHFSKKSDEWSTPQDLFDSLNKEFGPFDLDVCATKLNKKCSSFLTKQDNGLDVAWKAKNWCNPPYSELKKWIAKAYEEMLQENMTIMLIPARTDTIAFHEYIYGKKNIEVRFLKGRLKFGKSKNTAPFPSMVVIFGTHLI